MALATGARLGRYEVLGLMGAGGMGEVYKARDTRLLRTVALKVLPPQLAADPARRERFEREARAASALEHPHICVLHDIGAEGGVDFLVLELLEGETLAARLARGRMPREEALRIGTQIADALDAAHGKGIVHRDLKPGNVMLARSGVKLLDFGLARLTEEAPGGVESTAWLLSGAGMVAGTLPYMSPEQLTGAKVDARSDIWALGVVLYEMLTGRRPFHGGSATTLMVAILEQEPPSLTSVEPLAPPALEHLVGRCLAKDPEARWQTARDVASELGWVSQGRTAAPGAVLARPAAPALRRRRGRAWALLGAAAVVVAVGVAGAWWWHTRTRQPVLDPKRVAVAVFENRTGDPSLDPLGHRAADQIAAGLTRIEGLQVVPSATGSAGPAVSKLAAETGAGLVVSGTYALEGGELRIQPRLADATAGRVQALPPAAGPRSAPGAAVEGARQRVMGAVAVHLDPFWPGVVEQDPPTYDAYQEFLTAHDVGAQPIPHLRRALELDPGFVAARFRLVSWLLTDRDYAEASRELEVLEGRRTTLSPYLRHHADALRALLEGRNGDAYVAVREARKLLPNDALTAFHFASYAGDANRLHEAVETLTAPLDWARFHARSGVLGGAYFWHLTTMLHRLGEHERELAEIRRGQQLHPELPWLLGQATYALAALGRLNEMERAVAERTSLASAAQRGHFLMFVGLELRAHGHGEAAERMLARSVEAFRGTSAQEARGQEGMLAIALKLTGRCGEARAILRRFARESPDVTNLAGDRAVVEALCGDRAEARRISDALGRLTRPYLLGQNNFVRARIAAQLGEKDAAVDLLRMAYAQGFGSFDQNWVHLEPALESLRGYPPYEELMKPM